MQAYQVQSLEQPPQCVETPRPEPRPGQVQIKIMACGVNFADLLMSRGQYQEKQEVPFTLGIEPAGIITKIGTGVANRALGDRVAVPTGQGGMAEYGCFDADLCVSLPDDMPFDIAAAIPIAHGTSHLALDQRAALQPGETVLVLGAAGGVGLSAISIAKLMGARVIAVARGPQKLAIAKAAGADHLIDSDKGDIRAVVKSLGGADVVYDPVGGPGANAALRACKPQARYLIIGFASGKLPDFPANILLVKNITVIGFYWSGYLKFDAPALLDSLNTLFNWYACGKLRPHISNILPLEAAADAFELLRLRKSTGKIVIRPQPASTLGDRTGE